ncbi:hypothetical protein MJO28_008249 [Puccinia striiformis f. sp. tritici]|uniref:Uncharacterized protein n=1 Tax=Puccinia striiformis f. sp. tritici TaxID=168172 RepID=A0ACC0EB98_9BASI|nr:hypothetical protein MJO28_008249 [Puccinia striiformis f. sp. tritici]
MFNLGASYAGIALSMILVYSWFTICTTAWRSQINERIVLLRANLPSPIPKTSCVMKRIIERLAY